MCLSGCADRSEPWNISIGCRRTPRSAASGLGIPLANDCRLDARPILGTGGDTFDTIVYQGYMDGCYS
jgi:hypothetical protein